MPDFAEMPETVLMDAVMSDLRMLQQDGGNMHAVMQGGRTYAHVASERRSAVSIAWLRREGYSVDTPDDSGMRPLHVAVASCDDPWLVEAFRDAADPRAVTHEGYSAMRYAMERGHANAMGALAAIGGDPNSTLPDGSSALHVAAKANAPRVIRELCDAGADPEARDHLGNSAVACAAAGDHVAALAELLVQGADANVPNDAGDLPMHAAAARNALATLMALSGHVDPNGQDPNGRLAIEIAAEAGHADAIGMLAGMGADPNALNSFEATAMHAAAGGNHVAALAALREAGGRMDLQDEDGNLPLHRAAEAGQVDALRYLSNGLSAEELNALNRKGTRPIDSAVYRGHADAAELLIDMGVDPATRDWKGRSVTQHAIAGGHMEVLRMLARRGVDLGERDSSGASVLAAYAREHGEDAGVDREEIANFLEAWRPPTADVSRLSPPPQSGANSMPFPAGALPALPASPTALGAAQRGPAGPAPQ